MSRAKRAEVNKLLKVNGIYSVEEAGGDFRVRDAE